MKFGVVAETGREQHMRVVRGITFFIILGTRSDRATTIIGGCIVGSSLATRLRVVIPMLKVAINGELVIASSNNDLKTIICISWVVHGKILVVMIMNIYTAWEETKIAMNWKATTILGGAFGNRWTSNGDYCCILER